MCCFDSLLPRQGYRFCQTGGDIFEIRLQEIVRSNIVAVNMTNGLILLISGCTGMDSRCRAGVEGGVPTSGLHRTKRNRHPIRG